MFGKIGTAMKEYNQHAPSIILPTFFTVMLWMSAQTLINSMVAEYAPGTSPGEVAIIELFIASFGLWFLSQGGMDKITEMIRKREKRDGLEQPPRSG